MDDALELTFLCLNFNGGCIFVPKFRIDTAVMKIEKIDMLTKMLRSTVLHSRK
jgi:hypothetical protein